MAETRRTQGPWRVSACAPLHRDEVLGQLQGMTRLVVAVPRRRIRGRRGEPVRWAETDSETQANLRLIAAAPELLEALRFVLAHAFEAKWAGDERALELVETAIAKAEGRAP